MTTIPAAAKRPYAPRMPPHERREQLLDATLRVIVRNGVHKVSIDSVAKEAGVARPVVYSQFADSKELLRASLTREEEGAMSQLASILPRTRSGNPVDAAVAALAGFLSAVIDEPERWLAAFSLVDSSTPEFRSRVHRAQQLTISTFEDLVRWAIDEGLSSETDVEMLARMLFAAFWDSGKLALADPKGFPPDRIVAFGRHMIELHLQPR